MSFLSRAAAKKANWGRNSLAVGSYVRSNLDALYPASVWVDATGGDDANTGLSSTDPVRTYDQAATVATSSGRTRIIAGRGGAYEAPVTDLTRDAAGVRSAAVASLLSSMSSRRVDFVAYGDSNQVLGSHGWDHGWTTALRAAYAQYATQLLRLDTHFAEGVYANGYTVSYDDSGAPEGLDQYAPKSVDFSGRTYAFVADGSTNNNGNIGINITSDADYQELDLRYHLYHGTFDSGSGEFYMSIRLNQSPYTEYIKSGPHATNTGSLGIAHRTLDLSADAARAGMTLAARPIGNGNTTTGPAFFLYNRLEATGRTAGFAFSSFYHVGGQSLYDMAKATQDWGSPALTQYFSAIRETQGATPRVVVVINSGLNDRGETETSVGSVPNSDGDSREAFLDNLLAITTAIENTWTANGWDLEELHFICYSAHPVSDPEDTELETYRDVSRLWALMGERRTAVDMSGLTDNAEMSSSGWYASGGSDVSHLTQAGYEALAPRIIDYVLDGTIP